MERSAGRLIAGFGVALMASVPAMVASFIPLEDALARLETVSTTTTGSMSDAMDRALASAREWSSQHVQSTTEIIQAQTELATAGLNTEQALAGVSVAAKMATATGDDLRESAQLLASLFNTFGQVGSMQGMGPEDAFERMGDSLAETIKRFQVTMVPLRQGLSYITGQATVLGLSLDEVNTALGILNTSGIRASQAGTGLQNVFIRMDEAIERLNLDVMAFTDEAGNFSSISDFVDELARSLEGMSSFERVIALQDAFGQRAARSAAILIQQRDALRGISAELGATSGQAAKMQAIIEGTTGSRLRIAVNNIKNFSQAVGQGLAGSFQTIAGAITTAFGALSLWAGQSAQAAAATIFLTGAVVAFYGGLKILNAVLAISGAQTVTLGGAFKALGLVFIKFVAIAAVAFAAFTLLTKLFSGRDSIKAGLAESLNDKNFDPIAKSLARITSNAQQATKAIEDMARAGKAFPEKRLTELGFNKQEVDSLKGGSSAVTESARAIRGAFSGAAESFGLPEDFGTGIGQQVNEAVAALNDLGVQGPSALKGMAEAMQMVSKVPFGDETADKWQTVLGHLRDAEKKFIGDAQRITGRTFASGFEAIMGVRENEGFQKMALKFGVGSHLNPEDLVAVLKSMAPEAAKSAEQFYKDLGVLLATARDRGLMASMKDVNPELWTALTKSFTIDGRMAVPVADAVYEAAQDGDYERTGKTIAGKVVDFFVNNVGNDLSGLDLAAIIYQNVKGVTSEQMKPLFDFAVPLGKALSFKPDVSAAENLFNRVSAAAKVSEEGMKKGFDSASLDIYISRLSNVADAAERARDLHVEWLKALEGLKASMPGALVGTEAERAIDDMMKTASEGLARWTADFAAAESRLADSEAFKRLGGDQGRFTEEIVKGGGGAIAQALSDSLLTGSLDSFKKSLFESAYESLQQGIVDGVKIGLLKASYLKGLFDVEGISKQVQSALEGSVNAAGRIDPAKFAENLAPVREAMRTNLAQAMEVLAPIQQVLASFFQGTGLDVFGEMFSDKRKAAIEEMTNSLRQQEAALGQLQATLYTASEAEKEFIQAQIAFQRGSGSVLGQDIGTLDIAGRIALIQNLITEAQTRGLEGQARAFSDLLAKQFEAMEKARNLSQAGGISPNDMTKIAQEATSVADALNQPIGMREDVATISRDLQAGRQAAEGLRDALASIGIGSGSLMPSQITVSGATGASQQITLNFGSTQIVIEAGSAVSTADLDRLRARLDEEWGKKREDLIQMIRQGAPR